MGGPKALKKMADDWIDQAREDLAEGGRRVVHTCYDCPFGKTVLPVEKEPSGNPKTKCSHPATWAPPEPLEVEVSQHGVIPHNCPLKVRPITVFLDPREDV